MASERHKNYFEPFGSKGRRLCCMQLGVNHEHPRRRPGRTGIRQVYASSRPARTVRLHCPGGPASTERSTVRCKTSSAQTPMAALRDERGRRCMLRNPWGVL